MREHLAKSRDNVMTIHAGMEPVVNNRPNANQLSVCPKGEIAAACDTEATARLPARGGRKAL